MNPSPPRRRQLLIGSAVACLGLSRTALAQERLRIGLTAVILADQAAFLGRWAAYLSERIGTPVSFGVRDEYQPIIDQLASGQLDAAWICGYPFVRFQSQLQLVAVPLYRRLPQYESYLIRPAGEASLRGWADVKGRVFAYSDPLSNSGWLVAQGELAAVGLSARDFTRSFFAHGHRNVAEAVASRLATAGSIDGYVWETMRLQGMAGALRTEVVWKSRPHGFPPIVAPAGAAGTRLGALSRTLQAMTGDNDGRALLKALNLDGFVPGQLGWYDSIRQLARSVPGSGVNA